ncbi:hypothetical protein C8J57DRAFT_1232751 [Mycena rebaudengoi]|nr:hypothetical protein C8J57DRAFT_1232751 [Mycena rebaudengoi]
MTGWPSPELNGELQPTAILNYLSNSWMCAACVMLEMSRANGNTINGFGAPTERFNMKGCAAEVHLCLGVLRCGTCQRFTRPRTQLASRKQQIKNGCQQHTCRINTPLVHDVCDARTFHYKLDRNGQRFMAEDIKMGAVGCKRKWEESPGEEGGPEVYSAETVNAGVGKRVNLAVVMASDGLPPVSMTATVVESSGYPQYSPCSARPSKSCLALRRDGTVHGTAVTGTRLSSDISIGYS